jgi:hypothetical protein
MLTANAFDSAAFISEMEVRSMAAHGRPLTQRELRDLGKMSRVYCEQYNVTRG